MSATLHMLCGKIASGKSTLAAEIRARTGAVVLSEDWLLSTLYPGEIRSIEDFSRASERLRAAIGPHIVDLLRAGLDVALDFHANTRTTRGWMRGLIDAAGADHLLHVLDVPDAECLRRLRLRNASGSHAYRVSDEDFALFTRYFSPPEEAEGFVIAR